MDIFVYAFLFLNVFRVCDYIAAGLDGKIVDADGVIKSSSIGCSLRDGPHFIFSEPLSAFPEPQ